MRNATVARMEEIPPSSDHSSNPAPDRTHADGEDAGDGSVTRSVEIDAPLDDVWEAVADPERRMEWLDDHEALARITRIDGVDPGRSLSWTWWRAGDAETATRVRVTLDEGAAGATVVTVTERRLPPRSRAAGVTAQASAGANSSTAAAMTASTGTAGLHLWDRRLLGLALLFVSSGLVACR